jgi:hypothetical protein
LSDLRDGSGALGVVVGGVVGGIVLLSSYHWAGDSA